MRGPFVTLARVRILSELAVVNGRCFAIDSVVAGRFGSRKMAECMAELGLIEVLAWL